MRKAAIRWIGFPLLGSALLILIGYVAFVPWPREPGYEFVASWGQQGNGPAEFHDPTGLAIAGDELFVSDARNGRIQVFDFDGNFVRTFGRPGDTLGELGRPMNLATRNDALYVPEYFNDRIQIFGLEGTPRTAIGMPGSEPGQFDAPGGVAVDADGNLYVADFYNHRVQMLSASGEFVRQFGEPRQAGTGAGEFSYPTDVAVGRNGLLYIADGYNDRIQMFGSTGNFIGKWGGPFAMNIFGPFRGWFATVTSVAVDLDGNVFAADFYNHRIQKFAADGRFLVSFGERGMGPGQFDYPIAVVAADDGTVFVADFGNHRIQKWRPGSDVPASE